jgi:hypothetical protein
MMFPTPTVLTKIMEFQEDQYERFNPIDAEVGFNAGDEVQAEAQDGSGLNNANFGTLVDGLNLQCRCSCGAPLLW